MARPKKSTRSDIIAYYGTKVRDIRLGETEEQYYRALVKIANDRLYKLEIASTKEHFHGILNYAYSTAVYEARAQRNDPDARRFSLKLKRTKTGEISKRDLHAKMNAVKQFLESPTSMVSTTEMMYQKRVDTFNRNHKTNFTWQEYGNLFEKEEAKALFGKYGGSLTIVKAIAKLKRAEDAGNFDKPLKANKRVRGDEAITEVANDLREMGYSAKDLLS